MFIFVINPQDFANGVQCVESAFWIVSLGGISVSYLPKRWDIFIPVRSLIAEVNLTYDCHTMSVDSFVTNMCVVGDQKLPGNMLLIPCVWDYSVLRVGQLSWNSGQAADWTNEEPNFESWRH